MSARRNTPEKAVERAGDLFMQTLGYVQIRFSQARATQQTRGIPDRRYYDTRGNPAPAALWWEAKSPVGKQSPDQRAFQELAESAGEVYLCGTDAVLHEWAIRHRLVERLTNGFRVLPLRYRP